jgi:hypothetical protein
MQEWAKAARLSVPAGHLLCGQETKISFDWVGGMSTHMIRVSAFRARELSAQDAGARVWSWSASFLGSGGWGKEKERALRPQGQCCCGRKMASTQTSRALYKDETLTLRSYLAPF